MGDFEIADRLVAPRRGIDLLREEALGAVALRLGEADLGVALAHPRLRLGELGGEVVGAQERDELSLPHA
jgi:hypothetical protein